LAARRRWRRTQPFGHCIVSKGNFARIAQLHRPHFNSRLAARELDAGGFERMLD
jgi:hypothetical protein